MRRACSEFSTTGRDHFDSCLKCGRPFVEHAPPSSRASWTWKDAALVVFAVLMPGGVSMLVVWWMARKAWKERTARQ